MMRAHLEKAAIVLAVLADEDRLHRRLHVVVHAAPTGAFEESERPLVGVEHHLLRLARIGANEHHAAVADAQMPRPSRSSSPRPSQRSRGSSRIDRPRPARTSAAQRHLPSRWRSSCRPGPRIAADGVIAAFVAGRPQLLENPDERQPLARRRLGVRRQQPIEFAPFHRPASGAAALGTHRKTTCRPTAELSAPCCGTVRSRAISLIDFP